MGPINYKHFTLGIEEEYMVMDPQTRELKSHEQKIVSEGQKIIRDQVKAEISVIEPTGSETQVFAKIGGEKIVGVFRERVAARPGEILPIAPDPAAGHLFDTNTGQRLN